MALVAISPTGVHTPWIYPTQTAQGLGLTAAFGAAPSSVNQPLFFQPNRDLSGGRRELWIIATGISTNWGGCEVHVSVDNTTFFQTGAIGRGGVQGALTAAFPTGPDPDTTDTLSVDISQTSGGQIIAGTMQDADLLLTLAVVDTEVVAYTSATLTGTGLYDLGTYLRRGAYCTPVSSHAAGAQFGLLNNGVYVHEYPTNLVGTVLYFKFPSFNTMGAALEDIATVPTYAWVLLPQPPEVPIGLAATCETCGACANVALQWEENLSCDHVTFYHVFRATGTGQPFSAALPVAAVDALNWLDTGLQLGSAHTYFLLAENEDGFSNPSAGVDVTCGGGAGVPPTGGCDPAIEFGTFERGTPADGAITRWDAAAEEGTFPIDFQGSDGYAKTAATSSSSGIINLIHAGSATQIGTFSVAAGSHVPTFASTGHLAHSFADDDLVEIIWPNPADATLADVALTLWATRDCNTVPLGGPPPPPTTTVVNLPPGTTSFTVPPAVTTLLRVEGVGGGGGAAGWSTLHNHDASSGGGGAGYVKLVNFAVTPGQVIPVSVGAGGVGISGFGAAGNGGDTTFNGGNFATGGFSAFGGQAGGSDLVHIGLAGTAEGPRGALKFPGGNGGGAVFLGTGSGGGGGGAGGPLGMGARGGSAALILFHVTDVSGGPGGGGAGGGTAGQSTPIGTVSGAGGASGDGTPGGAGATSAIVMGTVVTTGAGAGSSGSGAGGGGDSFGAIFGSGADGGDGDPSGGGGGGGGAGSSRGDAGHGGNGGQYGGGAGGGAGGSGSTRGGNGGDGLLRITY